VPRAIAVAVVATFLLALPTSAAAHDNGQGLLGETTDKLVTFFSLGVVVFIAAFVVGMSLIQHALERRHETEHAQPPRAGW
jgi:hypothetical protein